MRKQEIELLENVERIQKDQIYLMQTPKTPQQQLLHLFAHRHLLKQKMIHKNIDKVVNLLKGSFAQSSLELAYTTLCIQNQIEVSEGLSSLLPLVHSWVEFYPTIDRAQKVNLCELILQEGMSIQDISGYDVYLHYVNLISTDLWKLIKKAKSIDDFFREKPFNEQVGVWSKADLKHLDAVDLLTFVSSCIPKVLLNIILEKPSLPAQMRKKCEKLQCLFSNQNIEYYLRNSPKLSLLLKSIFLALFSLNLNTSQQKFLMLLAMRYYFVFHFDRRLSAAQIFVFSFNKNSQQARLLLKDQFLLFLKIVKKLGKQKFLAFLEKNSVFLKQLIETVNKKPLVGYSQDTAMPYNTIGVGETINLERGETTCRYFQILQEYSIFYYRILVKTLDIAVRLYYMGSVASEASRKALLLTQQKKSGEIKNCVNAMKKGIYMFEFDNSYSWINGKSLKYENMIYCPLEIKSIEYQEWIEDFYENIYQNCLKEEDVYVVEKKLPTKKHQKATGNQANLSKRQNSFLLTINRQQQYYEYQTDSAERMEQKITAVLKDRAEMFKDKDELSWTILNKPVQSVAELQSFIRGIVPPHAITGNERSEATQKIQKYQEDEEEQVQIADEEYQVVERKLQQSQIFNESTTAPTLSSRTHLEASKKGKQRQAEGRGKDQILCNSEQADQFYSQNA